MTYNAAPQWELGIVVSQGTRFSDTHKSDKKDLLKAIKYRISCFRWK